MDSLKSLMDKKEYDLVIKLTNNTQDIHYLFYRISALLATGKSEEALECINANQKILEGDLVLLMHIDIDILCLLGKFDDAYKKLEYYENLPYVSQEVEEALRDLPQLIRSEERKANTFKTFNPEKIKKSLLSQDQNDVLMALDGLRDFDVSAFLPEIQKIMLNYPKPTIRSFALMLLVQKQFNKELKFNHLGNVISVNPSLIEPPFVGDKFNKFVNQIQSELKNPSLSETIIRLLSSYVIYVYPRDIIIDNNDYLLEALKTIGASYLSADIESPNDRALAKGLDIQKLEELTKEIQTCVEDF